MGLFSACFIVLDLPSWPRRQRLQLKEKLTAHGAVISHAVTSQCTHLVVSAEGAGSPLRLKLAAKHGVRVVCPKFLYRCFAAGQLLEPALAADPADNNNIVVVGNEERANGVVTRALSNRTGDHKRGPPAEETFELNKVKLWVDDDEDNNRPAFPEEFEMVRSAIFHKTSEKEQTKEEYWSVVEIQAAPHSSGLVFRVAAYHASCRSPDKVTSRLTKVRMAGSGRGAEVLLGHACELLTGERCRMVKVEQLPAGLQLGSRMFQQAQTEISMANFHLSKDVGRFVSFVWSEALGHLSQILQMPVLLIEPKQVTKAEAILLQLKKAVLSKDVHDEGALERLSNEFYKIIPQQPQAVCPLTGMASISAKLDLCQLIRDVVDANEATRKNNTDGDDSSMGEQDLALKKLTALSRNATTLAQFTALRCSLLHLEPNSSDFNSLRNQLLQSSHGRLDGFKILKIFRVDRPAEIGQFRSEVGNTRSLFHAFTPRSLLGILSRGLLLPKTVVGEFGVERTDIGMLGCGIYFSDSISTSVKYARRAAAQDGSRVLAVCDVALGRCHLVRHRDPSLAAPPQGHDSLHGARATPGTASEFEDDEFVIYDARQQKLRYIVQFCLESDEVKEEENSDDEEFYEAPETPADERILPEPNVSELLPEPGEPKKRLSGLHSGAGLPVPLKAVHVRANILDFTAQVVVMQEYDNESTDPIEAKFTFPLDEMAAVCSFEAFINGKHIVGQVKEKETAHRRYREAVSQGHGAYLMDQESPDVFVVSVGNLPPASRVLIKVTYVCELAADGAAVRFRLPGNLAPWQQRLATGDVTQETVETLAVAKHSGRLSVQVSVEMPYEIINVTSPTHAIRIKRTACKAVVELASSDDSLGSEFQLLVFPAQIHEPRMWVEQNPDTGSQVMIAEMKSRIVELSKEYSIITPYTSFVAVEERDSTLADEATGPALDELLSKESVDFLPYVGWVVEEEKQGSMQFHLGAEKTKSPVGGGGGLVSSKIKYRKARPSCCHVLPKKTEQTPEIEFGGAAECVELPPFEIEAAADEASQYISGIQTKFAHASVEAVTGSSKGSSNLFRRDVKDDGVSASHITMMSASKRFGELQHLKRATQVSLKEAAECQQLQKGFGSSAYVPRSVVRQLSSAGKRVSLARAQASAPLNTLDNLHPVGASLDVIAMETRRSCTPPYQDTFEQCLARLQSEECSDKQAYPLERQERLARVRKPPSPIFCFGARGRPGAAPMPDVHELGAGLMSRVPERAKRDMSVMQLPNRDSAPEYYTSAMSSSFGSILSSPLSGHSLAPIHTPLFLEERSTDIPEPPLPPPPPPVPRVLNDQCTFPASPSGASRFERPMQYAFQSLSYEASSRLREEPPFEGSSNLSESFSSEDEFQLACYYGSFLMADTSRGSPGLGSCGPSELSDMTPWQHADLSKITCLQNKDGFWDGGVELSSLVGWSPDHITVILKKQGIQSLGPRMEEAVVRLVWTLLVLQILRLRAGVASSLNEFVLLLLRRDASTLVQLDMFEPGSADAFARAASWIRATESACPCACTRLELGPNWQAATCSLLGVA
ncbi:protein mono-ADP-ribosyltransferase PARP4 isoform X2 [Lampetra fluviatilis]